MKAYRIPVRLILFFVNGCRSGLGYSIAAEWQYSRWKFCEIFGHQRRVLSTPWIQLSGWCLVVAIVAGLNPPPPVKSDHASPSPNLAKGSSATTVPRRAGAIAQGKSGVPSGVVPAKNNSIPIAVTKKKPGSRRAVVPRQIHTHQSLREVKERVLAALEPLRDILVECLQNIWGWICSLVWWDNLTANLVRYELNGLLWCVLWGVLRSLVRAKDRLIIETFVNHTNDPRFTTVGLETLLTTELVRLSKLYQDVEEQRATPTKTWINHPVKTTLKSMDMGEMLKGAVSSDSKLTVGPVSVPIGSLIALAARLNQGQRIIGNLHKDGSSIILTAQVFGGGKSYSWRVDNRDQLSRTPKGQEPPIKIDSLVAELACRIFTDLALSSSARWKAARAFSEGLRSYRECLRTPGKRRAHLRQAEEKFFQTLAQDEQFDLAYYNLGVVYTELEQPVAAEAAFLKATERNPRRWEAYYALANNLFQRGEQKRRGSISALPCKEDERYGLYESVTQLCNRIIELETKDPIALAKTYDLKSFAENRLRIYRKNTPENHGEELDAERNQDIRSSRQAVRYAWRALYAAERWGEKSASRTTAFVSPERLLASNCLCNLAIAQIRQIYDIQHGTAAAAGKVSGGAHQQVASGPVHKLFWRAELACRQALALNPSDARIHFQFGTVYHRWNKLPEAIKQYESAVYIEPEKPEFWAYLSLAYASNGRSHHANHAFQMMLDRASTSSLDDFRDAVCSAMSLGPPNVTGLQALLEWGRTQLGYQTTLGQQNTKDALNDLDAKIKEFLKVKPCEMKQRVDHMVSAASPVLAAAKDYRVKRIPGWGSEELEQSIHILVDMADILSFLQFLIDNRGNTGSHYLQQLQHQYKAAKEPEQQWTRGRAAYEIGQLLATGDGNIGGTQHAEHWFEKAFKCIDPKYPHESRSLNLRSWIARSLVVKDNQPGDQGGTHTAGAGERNWFTNAFLEVRTAVWLDPTQCFDRLTLGEVYSAHGQFAMAAKEWEGALQNSHDDPSIFFKIGRSYFCLAKDCKDIIERRNALHSAAEYLEKSSELLKHRLAVPTDLCLRDGNIGRPSAPFNPKDLAITHYWQGRVYFELGQYTAACEHLTMARRMDFAHHVGGLYLAFAQMKIGAYAESLQTLKEVIGSVCQRSAQVKPEERADGNVDTDVHMTLGEVHLLANLGQLRTYLERDAPTPNGLATVRKLQNLVMTRVLGEVQHQYVAQCAHYEGWILLKMDQIEEAIERLKYSVTLEADPEAYLHLALAYERQAHESSSETPTDTVLPASPLPQARTHCANCQRLDVKEEYTEQIDQLLSRLDSLP